MRLVPSRLASTVAAVALGLCGASEAGAIGSAAAPAKAWTAPPPNVAFDYQIGGDYAPPTGAKVVIRDWFEGRPARGRYSICYVNAYQTQADDPGANRPDERSRWPRDLVLSALGDDPNWGGEYLVDISSAAKRQRAAAWVAPMLATCARKGFRAVELDNLDSWTRFDDTPLASRVPFERRDAVEYAKLLTRDAHRRGLAVGQKNAPQLDKRTSRSVIGFDFAVAEECGRYRECARYTSSFGGRVLDIEYDDAGFNRACAAVGPRIAVIRRDLDVTRPGSGTYRYRAC